MKYYSTNHQSPVASLEEAVVKGLASDKGLFMPEAVKMLPEEFYDNIEHLSFQEIAYRVADAFFGEDVPADTLKQIVYDTLSFDVPAVKVKDNIYSLELFHGPTLAFKDVGGRFMALPGSGRYPCVCALSQRKGQRNSGKAVHYAGTEYYGFGSRRYV